MSWFRRRGAIRRYDDPKPDPDTVWFEGVAPDDDGAQPRTVPATLSLKQTCECAGVLLQLILTDADLRRRYYDVSRSWHNRYDAGGAGGNYDSKWLELLVSKLPIEYAAITMQDFANVHAHMFYTLQRAVLAITSHNIDIDAIDHYKKPGHVNIESFHWIPNDNVDPSVTPGAMGFSKLAP